MNIKLRFLGAARNVTGSSYLLESCGTRILVDCGMYQERELKARNWASFPVPPGDIDAVLLTHAHLDHCGLLPRLVTQGFAGRIYCTPATADIARIVLLDSAKIQVEDAAFKRKRHAREGRKGPQPEVPLYTVAEAEACMPRFAAAPYEQPVTLADGLTVSFHDAGHILGASMIRAEARCNGSRSTLIFSGDVGRWGMPILRDPTLFDEADHVLVESTYGNRVHKDEDTIADSLARVVNEAVKAGGKIVVPSFAIERTQDILYRMSALLRAGRIPRIPVFVDSPMAARVTDVFRRHTDLFDEEARELLRTGQHPCDFPGMKVCRTVEQSKAINDLPGTAMVIAGSGMCTGGRIKHHLVNCIGRPECTVLFIGYQANGTLGRIILEGAKQVRIHGQSRDVRARVVKINGFSAHADRDELFRWLSALKRAPARVFVVHGEPESAAGFAEWVSGKTDWPTSVPSYGDEAALA